MDDQNEVNMDELHEQNLEHAHETQAVLAGDLPPTGTYTSNPDEFGPLSITPVQNNEDPRQLFFMTGRGRAVIKGAEVTTRLQFRVSPEYRKKQLRDGDGELTGEASETQYDIASRLWAQAESAFKVTFGETPKKVGQVLDYLSGYPVKYRLIQVGIPTKSRPEPNGEPGTLIIAISPTKRGA